VLWPARGWVRQPSLRWVFASYSSGLSAPLLGARRGVLTSSWYQTRWLVRLANDQNEKTEFANTSGGRMIAFSASSVTPAIEGGQFWLLEGAAWSRAYRAELTAFPGGAHDDFVDATVQPLTYLRANPEPSIITYYRSRRYRSDPNRAAAQPTASNQRCRASPLQPRGRVLRYVQGESSRAAVDSKWARAGMHALREKTRNEFLDCYI
jgi:hypothetical protein